MLLGGNVSGVLSSYISVYLPHIAYHNVETNMVHCGS